MFIIVEALAWHIVLQKIFLFKICLNLYNQVIFGNCQKGQIKNSGVFITKKIKNNNGTKYIFFILKHLPNKVKKHTIKVRLGNTIVVSFYKMYI